MLCFYRVIMNNCSKNGIGFVFLYRYTISNLFIYVNLKVMKITTVFIISLFVSFCCLTGSAAFGTPPPDLPEVQKQHEQAHQQAHQQVLDESIKTQDEIRLKHEKIHKDQLKQHKENANKKHKHKDKHIKEASQATSDIIEQTENPPARREAHRRESRDRRRR